MHRGLWSMAWILGAGAGGHKFRDDAKLFGSSSRATTDRRRRAPMLALLALSAGFSAPHSTSKLPALSNSKLLALRGGGISTEALYNTVIGINGVTAFQGWLAPKKTMEMYGVADMAPAESVFLRTLSGMNFVSVVSGLRHCSHAPRSRAAKPNDHGAATLPHLRR